MSKIIASVIAVTLLSAPAFASGKKCDSPSQDQWMSKAELTSMYAEKGYDVKNLKSEDGCYEIYALDAKGKRVELLVDPMSGELLGTENDD
ncbi:MAG: PepSY domain-containing protein [Planktotalea sp.]|uniref:PepSY domain-containing protein n=1 Tax=Planktotalea sp. TaxID=2029877 RepID=UPI003C766381